jgi:hypothetical protein
MRYNSNQFDSVSISIQSVDPIKSSATSSLRKQLASFSLITCQMVDDLLLYVHLQVGCQSLELIDCNFSRFISAVRCFA